MKDFQGPKANFKYFQGLEIGLQKFTGFQEFQDTYEPCDQDAYLHLHAFINILCDTRSRMLLNAWLMSFLPFMYGQTVAL